MQAKRKTLLVPACVLAISQLEEQELDVCIAWLS